MSFVVPDQFRTTLIVYTKAAGSYVSGRWVEGSESPSNVVGSLQPLKPDEVAILPEGIRTSAKFKFYTDSVLQIFNEQQNIKGAQVVVDGLRYEVHGDMKHVVYTKHHKYILVEVNVL